LAITGFDSQVEIIATVDSSGALGAGGTIEILGDVVDKGWFGTLLAGTLTDFGYYYDPGNPTGGYFEFLFDITEGEAQSKFGAYGGMILYMGPRNSGYDGTFDLDFDNIGTEPWGDGASDTFVIPEPGTLSLLMLSLIAAKLRKRSLPKI